MQFGVFLSPRAADIGRLRDNAQAAEAAGFDFISVQDHPYVPDFLDTFALIGTLIGVTSRIRFMTDVANLPLRPPQMLAKASASLDLLSGGRFELGIGAGRAWPQIAGLGGSVRTPAEAVDATAEAVDVIRALWRPGGVATLPGRYYPLAAQAGPRRRTASASGSAPSARGCSTSSAARPMAGSLPWQPATKPSRELRIASTPPRAPRAGIRPASAVPSSSSARSPTCRTRRTALAPAGRPADPHHSGHLGQDHHRVRGRAAVRHRQPDPRAGHGRAVPAVRRRGDPAGPRRRHGRRRGVTKPARTSLRLPARG
jgi:alkanesulfonate monooxygenase SsuD/methylene tetrahydromethanopterin reductase-like flavin-dependent oxidoreductase (luciferase family)